MNLISALQDTVTRCIFPLPIILPSGQERRAVWLCTQSVCHASPQERSPDSYTFLAAGVTFVALLCSFSSHFTLVLIASLLSFLAALLTLIAFAIDISLYVIVRDRVNNLDNVGVRSIAGPGASIPT
jgi:hypothetical protein